MARVQNTDDKRWDVGQQELLSTAAGDAGRRGHLADSGQFLRKLNILLPCDPAVTLPGGRFPR